MTEITPIGTVTAVKTHLESLPENERFDLMARHGIPLAGLDLRVVNGHGKEVPWDGIAVGEIQVRGPWVTGGYYNDARSPESFVDGWLRTGDVATVDSEGYIQITDRTKDLVKSGGEWISSVDLENALMAHPKVAEAAVVGVFHPTGRSGRWPASCRARSTRNSSPNRRLLDFLAPRVAKWWLPDDMVFIEAVPKTSVGKFNKRACASSSRITNCRQPETLL